MLGLKSFIDHRILPSLRRGSTSIIHGHSPAPKHQIYDNTSDRIFFIIGLPKSAGNALRNTLGQCWANGPKDMANTPSIFAPSGLHVEYPLVDAVLQDFPEGGYYHSHVPASYITLDFLHRHKIRHVILVRNPLDQMVSYYCHIVKHANMGTSPISPWKNSLATTNPQAPIPIRTFDKETTLEEAFSILIRRGYLESVMDWIGRWIAFRHESLSVILTYERLMEDPKASVLSLIEFLQPMLKEPTAGIESATAAMGAYANASLTQDAHNEYRAYSKGYTGCVGVYKAYMSASNISEAAEAFYRFAESSPYGRDLAKLYPTIDS